MHGLTGCTEQVIRNKYHNRYKEVIYPADRDLVSQGLVSQMGEGRIAELEYRLVTEDGRLIWVMDRSILVTEEDGMEYIYTLLVDITQSRKAMEGLQESVERHKIILNQTKDVIFEWNVTTDEISYSSNWECKYGYQPIIEGIRRRLPYASHINPDDIPDVMKFTNDMMTGRQLGEVEFRLANAEGRYCWCRVRATAQFDPAGNTDKVIGIIEDIDDEKRETEKLIDRAERDVLTKLYNKRAARHKINRFLELSQGREGSAMLIIDVDNFKMVNDRYGHMFGDAVLTELAARITSHFRDSDIISRIGGDEFMVFMPGTVNHEMVTERAGRLMASLQTMFKNNMKDVPFSCSIGIAYSPEDGSDFQSLFQNSDAALYQAKLEGKNRWMQYCRPAVNAALELKEEADRPEEMRENTEHRGQGTVARVISMTFQELYDAADFDRAMNSILEITGRMFHVSRVYIFENCTDSDDFCTNTFEWCREGITPQRAKLRNVAYTDQGGDYRDNFNEEGVFYCLDITELRPELQYMLAEQGISSMLQCSITAEGAFKGFVGFDECEAGRIWTQEQIDCLVFLSKMLSTFLLKKRAEDKLRESMQNLEGILNNQNSWIYVIDGETYQLRYINEKTYQIAPETRLGMCCYEAFFKRNEPCEHCPVRECAGKESSILEVYNPVLNVWTLADSSRIRWGDREAFLLACHDISPYKRMEKEEAANR
ncbi:diguanylate cyclase domain-containing protein [Hungatella hathewayi]